MTALGERDDKHDSLRKASLTLLMSLTLSSCGIPTERISKVTALKLLNAGEVTQIGVSHSGWTIMTMRDGSSARNLADVIGYPAELLADCSNCDNVRQWIE